MGKIKSFASYQNLKNFKVFRNDDIINSEYFNISEFEEMFTGGKNAFLIQGSPYLKETTEVKIEVLDVEGNPVYSEPGNGIPEYYEGSSIVVAVHVYDDTPIGVGTVTILGELKSYIDDNGEVKLIPDEWKGVYNVKWQRKININKNLNNKTIVRFYERPTVFIEEIVKPLFNKTSEVIIQSGSVIGIPFSPPAGQDITKWNAGISYKLKINDGVTKFSSSVDGNVIYVTDHTYPSASSVMVYGNVQEILNDTELLMDKAYTINNIVSPFTSSLYFTSFENKLSTVDTSIISSFGIISMRNLKTFAGDVARVKIFRKSRNTAGDFELVQESRLETNELLRDIRTPTDTEIPYGYFTQDVYNTYWTASSTSHPVTINNDVLQSSLKIDYNEGVGGVQTIANKYYQIPMFDNSEYTLSFKTLLSGSISPDKSIKVYLGRFFKNPPERVFITEVSASSGINTRQLISTTFKVDGIANSRLEFDISGSDWYISDVSLRNSQETSFSPDEFTIIQPIDRKLPVETFDFKFEFYDINNNYIPVDVKSSKEFDGGNDYSTVGGSGGVSILTLDANLNSFKFISGSISNPPYQYIDFTVGGTTPSGSVVYTSAAFDTDGNYINPGSYGSNYPGGLLNRTNLGGRLTVANFSGSNPAFKVGSISYTASVDGLRAYQSIFRINDGSSPSGILSTSNVNQFIYRMTDLAPNPLNQSAEIQVRRYNLSSSNSPITVNSSSNFFNPPPLTSIGTDISTGISKYSISALLYSSSNAGNQFPTTTYSFTSSDEFGTSYSDQVTISPVVNYDGISITLSTENSTFKSDQNGYVTPSEFNNGDGTVDFKIGNDTIPFQYGLATSNNVFEIESVTPSTGLTVNSSHPPTNSYGISAMTVDSGYITLGIRYITGDGAHILNFSKKVNYVKARTGVSGSSGSGSVGPAGPSGSAGIKVASDTVYYQITASGQPSTPSATSYTLSTGTMSGLSANWGGSPPIYSGSNGNKYWYSKFVANENSPGSNVSSGGNLIFSAPKQAIGFTGLVTFTGPDSIDDGLGGQLSFGASGSTQIDGGVITTGVLKSQNLSTTLGSIFYLNNGIIKIGGTSVTGTSGKGIVLDGSNSSQPKFFIGNASTNYIRYNYTSDALEIKTPQFTVDSVGNATMSGSVTVGGTVKSSNLISGSLNPYTTQGTVLFLNTGNFHSQRFAMTSNGIFTPYFSVDTDKASFSGSIIGGEMSLGNNKFIVTGNGNLVMTGSSANFTNANVQIDGADLTLNTHNKKSRVLFSPGNELVFPSMKIYSNQSSVTSSYESVTYADASGHDFRFYQHPTGSSGPTSQIAFIKGYTYQNGATKNSASEENGLWLAGSEMVVIGKVTDTWNSSPFRLNTVTGDLSITGDITAFASDDRLKLRLGNIKSPLSKVNSLNGFLYKWNETAHKSSLYTDDSIHVGVSAQELEEVLPYIVKPAPFDISNDKSSVSLTGEKYKTVQYEKIIPLLIEAIKELSSKIDNLEQELKNLKNK